LTDAHDKPNRTPGPARDSEARAIAPIVCKVGAELPGIPFVGPLAGALLDLFKERKDRARESIQREADARLTTFFEEMLHADATMDEQVAQAMLDDADFHALLRACVADIEAEKVCAYATLARRIASGKVTQQWRRHFILSLRDFSNAELKLLQRAYVAKRFDVVGGHGMDSLRETDILKAGAPGSHHSILMTNLTTRGFVHEAKLSEIGDSFASACWREVQLTPAAVGRDTWTGHRVPIISYELGKPASYNLSIAIQSAFIADRVKTSIVAVLDDRAAKHVRMFSTMAVLLVGRESNNLLASLPHLIKVASNIPILVVEMAPNPVALPGLTPFDRVVCGDRNQAEVVNEIRQKLAMKSREL
jgi:hypothetical protein